MSLDAERSLSPATIAAITDILPRPEVPSVDDSALMRLALGIADSETRLRCAKALLVSPETRTRLVRMRLRLREEIEPGSRSDDLVQLGRLRVFEGPFDAKAANAVFPNRLDETSLRRLRERGWLEFRDERYSVTPYAQALADAPSDSEGPDAGWISRFVAHYAEVAKRIDGIVAEGRWAEGSRMLRCELPNLRAVWSLIDDGRIDEGTESLVRALAVHVMEIGAREEFGQILELGYRAAEILRRPALRSWLLSFEGVAASRAGDSWRAKRLWNERVELARREGFKVSEVDTLIDLAGQDYSDGDYEGWRQKVDAVQPLVESIGRPDYEASIEGMRAIDALRRGDVDAAAEHARRALALLSGVDGINRGLFVRTSVAKSLAACGLEWPACDALTDVLAMCAEGGRPLNAAIVLSELAALMEAQGHFGVARRCALVARNVHRQIGTRRVEESERALRELEARHPSIDAPGEARWNDDRQWAECVEAILDEVAQLRSQVPRGR